MVGRAHADVGEEADPLSGALDGSGGGVDESVAGRGGDEVTAAVPTHGIDASIRETRGEEQATPSAVP